MGEIPLLKGSLYHVDSALTDTKEPLKECFESVNNTLLLGRSVSSAKAGHSQGRSSLDIAGNDSIHVSDIIGDIIAPLAVFS